MPRMYELHDVDRIERYLRSHAGLHLYELGDLDAFFRPHTRWFALGAEPDALCLLYAHPAMATLVAMCEPERAEAVSSLLAALAGELPDRVYLHRSTCLPEAPLPGFQLDDHGIHHRMMLVAPTIDDVQTDGVRRLSPEDETAARAFYDEHYPEHWFDARMLETGCYFAAELDGRLASIAGVHVMSESLRVAALGNVATAKALRGHGLATQVTVAVLRHLQGRVEDIGLNVHGENAAAIGCYRKLGFAIVADYREAVASRPSD